MKKTSLKDHFSPMGRSLVGFSEQMFTERGSVRTTQMGVRTGLTLLDETIRGLTPGKLYVVGGRTGSGKTSFATTLTANILNMDMQSVLYISTELDFMEIWKQVVEARTGGVPFHPDKPHTVVEAEMMKKSITSTSSLLDRGEFSIVTKKKLDIEFIEQCINHHCDDRNGGRSSVVIIDQMSRIARQDKGGHGYAMATENLMNTLEELADLQDIPMVLLSQLNRGAVGERPMVKHLKHSGAIEEMAHCVVLLDRGEFIYGSGGFYESMILVEKNRHGPVKEIGARFNGPGHIWTEHEIYNRNGR